MTPHVRVWGGAVVAAGALALAVSTPPSSNGVGVSAPIVWEYPGERVRTEVRENADWRAYTTVLMAAGVDWAVRDHGPLTLDDAASCGAFAGLVATLVDDVGDGLLLMSIAARESRFAPDVLAGRVRGDDGAACGAFQMHLDIQKRPGDPSCDEAGRDPIAYVRAALRWLHDTPTAWGNIGMHRERVTRLRKQIGI